MGWTDEERGELFARMETSWGTLSERFTEHLQRAMVLASKEAQRSHDDFISTTHILIGLIQEERGVAAQTLKNLGVEISKVRSEIEKEVPSRPARVTIGRLLGPRARNVLELSAEEANEFRHDYLGTEHVLLGLLREEGCVAAAVLHRLGLSLDLVRQQILELLGVEIEHRNAVPPLQGEKSPGENGNFFTRLLRRLFPSSGDQ